MFFITSMDLDYQFNHIGQPQNIPDQSDFRDINLRTLMHDDACVVINTSIMMLTGVSFGDLVYLW